MFRLSTLSQMSWQEVGARTSISLHPTSLDTCFSGVRAGLDLHSPVETCGSRGGGAAGSGGHCGEAVWRAEREGPTAMRLRPAAGERGGSQSPSTAVNYEGEEKIFRFISVWEFFFPDVTLFFFFLQQCVWQLLFLLLVLMVNYQDATEQRQARLLHSAIKRRLHASPLGFPNLTSLKE